MATIVNNPAPAENQSNIGLILVVLVIFALAALYFFGAFRGVTGTNGSNNTGSQQGVESGTKIQIPDKINVNVNDQRDGK